MGYKPKLALGTAQLGMPYGVGNTKGMPSREESFELLDTAFSGGIDIFDTAHAYGASEEVLGAWINARSLGERVRVITKVGGATPKDLGDEIRASRGRLHIERLDGCLFHLPRHLADEHLVSALREARSSGLTRCIGVSVYEPEEALRALNLGMEYIQVPYNVLDQRFADIFTRASERGATTFARSPFLQGLLVMNPLNIPPHLADAKPLVERFQSIATAHGFPPSAAALCFALAHSGADYVVFGAETTAQLRESLSAMETVDSAVRELIQDLTPRFKDIPLDIVDPRLWREARSY